MKIKTVIFDIGQTLVYYPIPLNWSVLYRPAFESIAEKYKLNITENEYTHISEVPAKYNTRINPREIEVSSNTIFNEILNGTNISLEYLDVIKNDFYSFFRNDIKIYEDAVETLQEIKSRNIFIGTLSDVGYREPSGKGLEILSQKMKVLTSEMIFVGDENNGKYFKEHKKYSRNSSGQF